MQGPVLDEVLKFLKEADLPYHLNDVPGAEWPNHSSDILSQLPTAKLFIYYYY